MAISTVRVLPGPVVQCIEHNVSAHGETLPDALRELARILDLVGPERLEELGPVGNGGDVPFINRILALGRRAMGVDGVIGLGDALEALERPAWQPLATAPKDGRRVLLRENEAPAVAVVAKFYRGHWVCAWTMDPITGEHSLDQWAEIPL
jgi:hypothetical protein